MTSKLCLVSRIRRRSRADVVDGGHDGGQLASAVASFSATNSRYTDRDRQGASCRPHTRHDATVEPPAGDLARVGAVQRVGPIRIVGKGYGRCRRFPTMVPSRVYGGYRVWTIMRLRTGLLAEGTLI